MKFDIDLDKLKEEKRLVVRKLGIFEIKPARKGKINFRPESKNNYKYRITFTSSRVLKEQLCK